MTLTVEDLDLTMLDDPEETLACDCRRCILHEAHCERMATHYARASCCGATILLCKPCGHVLITIIRSRQHDGKMYSCHACGFKKPEVVFKPL